MFVRFVPINVVSCITALIILAEDDFEQPNKWKEVFSEFLFACVEQIKNAKKIGFHLSFNSKLLEGDINPEKLHENFMTFNINVQQKCACLIHVIDETIQKFSYKFDEYETDIKQYLLQGGIVVSVCNLDECQSQHPENDLLAITLKPEHQYIEKFVKTEDLPDYVKNLKL